jgi:catechol 2,3-dioxygenase-like lactoylglutathione lyase family enzyme
MFGNPQINLYVEDAERSARFYRDHFGFTETFRTPAEGSPVHVELQLDGFTLGVASIASLHDAHGVTTGPGPVAELVLWTDDVDAAYARLDTAGLRTVSAPHDFLDGALRAAWVADPDGHHVQLVRRRGEPAT